MYKIVDFNTSIDLTEFYNSAASKGFLNNSNQEVLYNSFTHFNKFKVWLLQYNDIFIGSVAAHSLEELGFLGNKAFRIAARTCILTDRDPNYPSLRTKNQILTHQNVTAQILLPLCIEWAGRNNDLYITSNEKKHGTQRLVHNIFCPLMQSIGVLEQPLEFEYRTALQYFWKINVDMFYKQLKDYQQAESMMSLKNYLGYDLF
jgi:hypothetical protein